MNGSLLGLHQSNCLVESSKCYLQEETFLRPVSNLLNSAFSVLNPSHKLTYRKLSCRTELKFYMTEQSTEQKRTE